jgi:hypothetical protein
MVNYGDKTRYVEKGNLYNFLDVVTISNGASSDYKFIVII